jgi:hypothetical protein
MGRHWNLDLFVEFSIFLFDRHLRIVLRHSRLDSIIQFQPGVSSIASNDIPCIEKTLLMEYFLSDRSEINGFDLTIINPHALTFMFKLFHNRSD